MNTIRSIRVKAPVLFPCVSFVLLLLAVRADAQSANERISERQFFDLYERGVEHEADGEYARALEDWLAAFDHSRTVPGLEEVRLTLTLDAMATLSEGYEPAHEALILRRDRVERALVEDRVVIEDAEELVSLNAFLAGPERNLAAWDRYRARRDADPEIVAVLRDLLWDDLVDAGRFEELADEAELRAGELIPLMDRAREAMERYNRSVSASDVHDAEPESFHVEEGESGEIWHEVGDDLDLVGEAIRVYEVLTGAGREASAKALKMAILKLEPEAEEALELP